MSENRTHISDQKWDQVLKAMNRREFIVSVTVRCEHIRKIWTSEPDRFILNLPHKCRD